LEDFNNLRKIDHQGSILINNSGVTMFGSRVLIRQLAISIIFFAFNDEYGNVAFTQSKPIEIGYISRIA